MPSRFVIAVVLSSILPVRVTYAQQVPCPPVSTEQVVHDAVISGAAFNDGYDDGMCGVGGEIYRLHRDQQLSTSIMRVAPDGSTSVFALPNDDVGVTQIAPTPAGLNVLSHGRSYRMYHFDREGRLLNQHQTSFVFTPSEMVVLPSGKTVAVGFRQLKNPMRVDLKFEGAVLDTDDQVVIGFDFPLTPAGGRWTPWMWGSEGKGMAAGDGVAYLILQSDHTFGIAIITEKGHVDVNILPVPPNSATRYHNQWLFGPGVAVEVYHDPSERPHPIDRFDEYDLASGQKLATKSAPGTGFAFGCYSGNQVSMLAHSAHVDPARHLSPNALRLVTSYLK